jgi:AcrR family transcriptional regulator
MSSRDPKKLILDAALSTFVELGFDRATVAHICARAGTSNGALFHHFATKDAIAEALYLRGIASYQEGLLRVIKGNRGADAARDTIKAAVRHHLVWVEANQDLAWFMYERGRPDWRPAQGPAVRRLNRTTAIQIGDWIAPLAAAGVIRNLPLPVLAACVIGPAHFIARRWVSGQITTRPSSFIDALADAAWAALAAGKVRRSPEQTCSASPAAAIEMAALEAVRAACPKSSPEDWTVAQLTMNALSHDAISEAAVAHVQSVRMEGDDRIAFVEVDLIGPGGSIVRHGHIMCARSGRASVTGEVRNRP